MLLRVAGLLIRLAVVILPVVILRIGIGTELLLVVILTVGHGRLRKQNGANNINGKTVAEKQENKGKNQSDNR